MKACTSVKCISLIHLLYSLNSFMLILEPVTSVPPITAEVPIIEIGKKVIYTTPTFVHLKFIAAKYK